MERIFRTDQVTGKIAMETDWSRHALGPIASWSAALRTAVGLLLNSRFPMFVAWGPQRHFFYNDAYAVILGEKHPSAFGRPFQEVWPEIWADLQPLIAAVDAGESLFQEDLKFVIHRHGYDEEAYFTFSYSPILESSGEIGGLFCAVVETTERLKSELALKASEKRVRENVERLRSVIEQAVVGICETDLTGRFILANDHYCKMVGRSREELLKLRMQDITHPDDLPGNRLQFERLIETNQGFEIEKRYVRPDKSIVWVHNSVSPVNRSFVVAVSTDITAKKAAQIEFEKNVDVSPAILWITDTEGVCTYLSKQWRDYTGQTVEEGLGFGWLEATHPDDRERAGQLFVESNAKQIPFYADYRLKTASGEYRWAIDAGNPRFGKNGEYLGYAGAVFDVHDRKLAEMRSEAERQKFEAIFVDSPTSIALVRGPDFTFDEVNPRFRELVGGREVVGRRLAEALTPSEAKTFLPLLDRVYQTGEPYVGRGLQLRYAGVEGAECDQWIDLGYHPFREENGEIGGVLAVVTDVTEQVEARRRAETLLEDVREAVRARDEFLSIASHELKTPLTSLKLQAQIYGRQIARHDSNSITQSRITTFLAQAEQQVLRLTRLVDDMLDVSRIRTGKLKIERERFDFGVLLEEVIERMTPQFSEVSPPQLVVVNPQEMTGDWDRLRLEQVLSNLLTNALRYGQGRPVEVRIEGRADVVRVAVKDEGMGISAEAQLKIFDRFERAVHANEISGLGLGLFIAKQIVTAHGGSIWVESEPSRGATFHVELPRKLPTELRV